MIRLTRRYRFSASHRLHSPALTERQNAELYGKCNNPHGHGHNYVLEVSVDGEVDPATGYLIDMKVLKDIVRGTVVDEVDHRNLSIEVPWLTGINTTAENLARVFFERIAPALPRGVRLAAVTVQETERNSASYRA